jgi:16S rRNA (cytidine1402-2'-O)-methyltransferase
MTLYIVATPIGNLEDISFRAVNALKEADLILAEDTRRTKILLNKYGINTHADSFNDHNKERKTPGIIQQLKQDRKIAIVSDSGTPGISDPGFYLVRECVQNGLDVIPIPGACAFLSALVASGLATDRFTFYGFLPKKSGRKKEILGQIKSRAETAILYESPYRLLKTLEDITESMPLRQIVVARELTKKFEEFARGAAEEVYEKLKDRKIKGEIVLVIG